MVDKEASVLMKLFINDIENHNIPCKHITLQQPVLVTALCTTFAERTQEKYFCSADWRKADVRVYSSELWWVW